MAASHFKSYVPIAKLRKLCKTDGMGTNLVGLIDAAKNLGFTARALRGEVKEETLSVKLIFPVIAHVIVENYGSMAKRDIRYERK